MKKSIIKLFAIALMLPFAFAGCNNDNPLKGIDSEKVAVQFRATNGSTAKSVYNGETRGLIFDNLITLNSFKINIEKIEFDFDDDDKWANKFGGTYSYDQDVKLSGPFEVDLISNGELQVKTLLSGLEIPAGKYEEIEFEMNKSRVKGSAMHNQSIRIEGEILGKPFVFASDREFDFEIEFRRPFVPGDDLGIIVDFRVNRLFTKAFSGIDFTQAIDVNGNGIIEIYYNEKDDKSHNYQLGKRIWEWFDDIIDCEFDD